MAEIGLKTPNIIRKRVHCLFSSATANCIGNWLLCPWSLSWANRAFQSKLYELRQLPTTTLLHRKLKPKPMLSFQLEIATSNMWTNGKEQKELSPPSSNWFSHNQYVASTALGTGYRKMREAFPPPCPLCTTTATTGGGFSLGDRDLHCFNLMCWVLRVGINCKGTMRPQWTNDSTHGFQGSLLTGYGTLVEVYKCN